MARRTGTGVRAMGRASSNKRRAGAAKPHIRLELVAGGVVDSVSFQTLRETNSVPRKQSLSSLATPHLSQQETTHA
jgi:hypothetical protein